MKRSRLIWLFLALLLSFLLPLSFAYYFVYEGAWPGLKVNHGRLIQPPQTLSDDMHWQTLDRHPFLWKNNAHKKWQLMYFVPSRCDESCQHAIYALHQVHVALNKDQEAFERVLVFTGQFSRQALKHIQADPYAKDARFLRVDPEAVKSMTASEDERIWVVDPDHWLVLVYPETQNPGDILKDLQRLMRAFHLGRSKT